MNIKVSSSKLGFISHILKWPFAHVRTKINKVFTKETPVNIKRAYIHQLITIYGRRKKKTVCQLWWLHCLASAWDVGKPPLFDQRRCVQSLSDEQQHVCWCKKGRSLTLGPYLKVLTRLIRLSLREENASRRDELLLRFVEAADEDIRCLSQSRKKKKAEQSSEESDEPDA